MHMCEHVHTSVYACTHARMRRSQRSVSPWDALDLEPVYCHRTVYAAWCMSSGVFLWVSSMLASAGVTDGLAPFSWRWTCTERYRASHLPSLGILSGFLNERFALWHKQIPRQAKNFSLIQNSNDRQWCFWNTGVGYLPHSIFLTECFMERREELMGWPSGYPKWLTQDASGVYCMQNTHARNNAYFKEDSYLGQQAWSLDRHWGPVAKVITEVGMSAWGVIWWAGKPERFRVHPGCCIMSCFCEN